MARGIDARDGDESLLEMGQMIDGIGVGTAVENDSSNGFHSVFASAWASGAFHRRASKNFALEFTASAPQRLDHKQKLEECPRRTAVVKAVVV